MANNLEVLCTSASGIRVVYDPIDSHTATHFSDNPNLKNLAKEALSGIRLEEELIEQDIDMGRIIGNTDVVEIDETDDVVYAVRKNREDQGHVPFTKSRSQEPSSLLSIYLVKKDTNTYELLSTWIGQYESPMFPQMSNATPESIPYWKSHAFVWGVKRLYRERN